MPDSDATTLPLSEGDILAMMQRGELSQSDQHLMLPVGLHPATRTLVLRFAQALALKLDAAEKKYGYRDGWATEDWMPECREKLREHLEKGDPRDVAAYCAFLWFRGERTDGPNDTIVTTSRKIVREGSSTIDYGTEQSKGPDWKDELDRAVRGEYGCKHLDAEGKFEITDEMVGRAYKELSFRNIDGASIRTALEAAING